MGCANSGSSGAAVCQARATHVAHGLTCMVRVSMDPACTPAVTPSPSLLPGETGTSIIHLFTDGEAEAQMSSDLPKVIGLESDRSWRRPHHGPLMYSSHTPEYPPCLASLHPTMPKPAQAPTSFSCTICPFPRLLTRVTCPLVRVSASAPRNPCSLEVILRLLKASLVPASKEKKKMRYSEGKALSFTEKRYFIMTEATSYSVQSL